MNSNVSVEDQKVSLGCWIISGIGLAAAGFMVWIFARVAREQRRKPDYVLMISNIRTASAILQSEDQLPDEDEASTSAKIARRQSGA